jgi:hypothetical protein
LIIGSGYPTDLPPVIVNLCTEMVCQLASGPMHRLMIINANNNQRRPIQQATTDKLDLIAWHDCPPLWSAGTLDQVWGVGRRGGCMHLSPASDDAPPGTTWPAPTSH